MEGPQKTANSRRQQCCLTLAEKLRSESGLTVNAQLVQLLQSPVTQHANLTGWGTLQLPQPAHEPKAFSS